MYRVGIDARMEHHSGIGTYVRGLLEGLEGHLTLKEKACLFGKSMPAASPDGWRRQDFPQKIYSVQEQIAYGRHLKECQLWHAVHYNVPYFKKNAKLVVTIHDIIHWIFRREFLTPAQRLYAGTMLKRAVTH